MLLRDIVNHALSSDARLHVNPIHMLFVPCANGFAATGPNLNRSFTSTHAVSYLYDAIITHKDGCNFLETSRDTSHEEPEVSGLARAHNRQTFDVIIFA